MGIDLTLTAKLPRKGLTRPAPAKFLESLTDAASELAADHMHALELHDLGPDGVEAYATFHPTAEPVRLAIAAGAVTLDARTSGTGPGYHRFICELADALADRLNLEWKADDETDYYKHRDQERLEASMLDWFQFLCRSLLKDHQSADTHPLAIAMPLGTYFPVDGAFAITPAGPRSRDWMESIAKDKSRARSFFTWWSNPPSPRDMLDEALVWMWMESRWSEPRTDAESRILDRTLHLLSTAHAADPALEMPWREWAQLLTIASPDDPLLARIKPRAAAIPPATPLVGYRRAPLITAMAPGGWTLQIPGSFSESMDDNSWIAFDQSRTIRVSSMTGQRTNTPLQLPPPLPERPPTSPLLTRPMPAGRANAYIAPETEDGHTYQQLTGEIVAMDDSSIDIGLLTVAFEDPVHSDWAIAIWESFTPPGKYSTKL